MTLSWKEWKLGDILYGVVVPLIVAFVIIAFPVYIGPAVHGFDPTLEQILVGGLEQAILVLGVPMLFGLLWNQWAGGAAGFLLGSIYALSTFQIYYPAVSGPNNFFLLGYVLNAMLVGYIAGALNKGSYSFFRMLIAGLVATIVGGLFLYLSYLLPGQPINMAAPDYAYSFFITIVPAIIYGIVVPIIAKVFTWFGLTPRRMS